MMGYAYYRIAMTISLMVFIVLVMVLYGNQVLTPVMIILLALLDDVPVILIAFDNAKVSPRPAGWDMNESWSSAQCFPCSACSRVPSCGHLHHGLKLDQPLIQTAMFMQLVIAGHVLLFCARASGNFWQRPLPEWRFFWAIMVTQLLAALMAANGWLMAAIPWSLIGFIWLFDLVFHGGD